MKFLKKKKITQVTMQTITAGSILCAGLGSAVAADVKVSGWLFYTGVERDSAEDLEFSTLLNSGAQLSFDATQDLGNGLTAGVNLRISSFDEPSGDDVNLDQRSISLSGAFGKIDIGQNLSASAFLDSYDGSPSYWVDPAGWFSVLAATGTSSVEGLASGLVTGSTTRVERLRYDTPTYAGLTGRVSVGDNGSSEFALAYSNHNIIANAFVVDSGEDGADDTTGFLLAYNAPFGLHASVNRSVQDRISGGEDEVSGWKLGYELGKHFVSYSTTEFDDSDVLDEYERSTLSYVYQAGKKFQVFAQYTDEERGALEDEAFAFGFGIFF